MGAAGGEADGRKGEGELALAARVRAGGGSGEGVPGSRPLEVLAVQVRETGPPRGQKPLEWLLVSSDGEPTKRDALRIVQRYGSRWGIEEYFRVLKSGMRI